MKNIDLLNGDAAEMLKKVPSETVDLVVTSPPYGIKIKSYGGVSKTWNAEKFKQIASELNRVLKTSGVLVWIVNDQCKKESNTLSLFEQVDYFEQIGLSKHDTMIWMKANPTPRKRGKRYVDAFEYMFVFSKGKPNTFNPIMRECKPSAKNKYVIDNNVWIIPTPSSKETNYVTKDGVEHYHEAVFPRELVKRHIQTWTNEGDVVMDCFLGSGTSGVVAVEMGRKFIGVEMNGDYFNFAKERIEATMEKMGIKEETAPFDMDFSDPWVRMLTDADRIASQLLDKNKVSDGDFLTEAKKVRLSVNDGTMSVNVQRVERSIYEKMGFNRYHYIDGSLINSSQCLLFSDWKEKPIAFVAFHNHTFSGCKNGMMVSRLVVLPQYQDKGLGIAIVRFLGGILSAKGYRLFINTEIEAFGKALGRCGAFRGTFFDGRNRKDYGNNRYKNRREGVAYRKEYIGKPLYGYGTLLRNLSELRREASFRTVYGSAATPMMACYGQPYLCASIGMTKTDGVCVSNVHKGIYISHQRWTGWNGSVGIRGSPCQCA